MQIARKAFHGPRGAVMVLVFVMVAAMVLGCCQVRQTTAPSGASAPAVDDAEHAVDYDKVVKARSDAVIAVTGSDFDEVVLNSDVPVLVDFWADWCGPCHMVRPVLEQVAGKYGDKLMVAKVDVDDPANRELSARYKVEGIPALFLINEGKVVDEWVGFSDDLGETLQAAIEKLVPEE